MNSTWQTLRQHPNAWKPHRVRRVILQAIRSFFDNQNFFEVESPILIAHPPAESYLDVFETTLFDRLRTSHPAYLSTSPETSLKKLMVAGIGNCYSLTKSFRNMETTSSSHNPEFTILEWYRVGAGYEEIMKDCELLFLHIADVLRQAQLLPLDLRQGRIRYGEVIVDLTAPWERMSMSDAFRRYADVSLDDFFDVHAARRISEHKGYTIEEKTTWEELFHQIFLNEIEPHLGKGRPTIVYEFPSAMAALARAKPSDFRYAERFEFYIEGLELGDCYRELTDATEQRRRFDAEMKEIRRLGKTEYAYDEDFLRALETGLPECSGIAVGVDRLVMLFADAPTIQQTLFFPASEMFGV